jgi:hypothetical protein
MFKVVLIVALIAGSLWGFLYLYEPVPQGRSMQGTVQQFCQELHRRNALAMQGLCSEAAGPRCGEIVEVIRGLERERGTTIASVNPDSYEFSATRGASTIDGHIEVLDSRGDTLWSGLIRVERMRDSEDWHITMIR